MAREPGWYEFVPDASAIVNCEGEAHRVTWHRGKVVLEAHDLTAERAMLAFGGEPCPCMRVLEMWVEQFRMSPDMFSQMHTWLGESAYLVPTEFDIPRKMAMVLTWERSWRFESWLGAKQARLLDAEVQERALPHLRRHLTAWKPRTGARVISGCKVALIPSTETVTLTGVTDRVAMKATAALHARWVVDVWARGVAVVDDAFVMRVDRAFTLDDLGVLAGRWEPTASGTWTAVTAPARARRAPGPDSDWHLEWDDR